MNALDLYRRARALGIQLGVVDGQVTFDAPPEALTPELLHELRASKDELRDLLSSPRDTTRRIWAEAVEEISQVWAQRVAELSEEEKDRLWLDGAIDTALQADIKTAILSEDLDRTLDAVHAWREAWGVCMRCDPNDPDPLFCASYASAASLDICPDGPASTCAAAPNDLPTNAGVHAMFDEAHERFAEHAHPDTFTTWLEKNAPELYQEWPDASPYASWLDWRLCIPQALGPTLSTAWERWLQERTLTATNPEPTPRARDHSNKRRQTAF